MSIKQAYVMAATILMSAGCTQTNIKTQGDDSSDLPLSSKSEAAVVMSKNVSSEEVDENIRTFLFEHLGVRFGDSFNAALPGENIVKVGRVKRIPAVKPYGFFDSAFAFYEDESLCSVLFYRDFDKKYSKRSVLDEVVKDLQKFSTLIGLSSDYVCTHFYGGTRDHFETIRGERHGRKRSEVGRDEPKPGIRVMTYDGGNLSLPPKMTGSFGYRYGIFFRDGELLKQKSDSVLRKEVNKGEKLSR